MRAALNFLDYDLIPSSLFLFTSMTLSKPSSITRAPRKFINHVKRLSRHSGKYSLTSLAAVNEDCLLHIVKYLEPRDILALKQVGNGTPFWSD